ncbi:hypothetical protein UFOVP395_202 [uncultured Caudovirales phage]|uniref:Uncharacterized protein n=1 Tax=uncultured Caudovirales phage TaxID=2100421 RepID=A0A6J5M5V7_9CAUD|nr:hypothetical protein UFOVP395_202 [uncultured Caudovirales phage]
MTHTFDESLVSDLHKDAYGFRPDSQYWSKWSSMTATEKQAEFDRLMQAAREEDDFQAKLEHEAYLSWSVDITELMAEHNISEARAIIWDMQNYVSDINDLSLYCYKRGLTWSIEMEIEKLIKGAA